MDDKKNIIESTKENKKPSFKMTITFYKSVSFLLIISVVLFIGFQEIKSIASIGQSLDTITREKLPEFAENRRTLVIVESLRRLAGITNISEVARERRNARLSADALITETAFEGDPHFVASAKKVAAAMKVLVAAKDDIDARKKDIAALEPQYYNSISSLIRLANNEEDLSYLFEANVNSFIQSPFQMRMGGDELQKRTQTQIVRIAEITQRIGLDTPEKKDEAKQHLRNIETSLKERLAIFDLVIQQTETAQELWKQIDAELKTMRDNISNVSEKSVAAALHSIKIISDSTLQYSIIMYAIIILFFSIYYASTYLLITRPLRKTSEKLTAIQEGDLNTTLPTFHIKEIADIASLLDRFSVYLAELYSHANQLEDDIAQKRNLEEIMRAVFKVSLDGYIVWNAERIITVSTGAMELLDLKTEEDFYAIWTEQIPLSQRAHDVLNKTQENLVWREESTLLNHLRHETFPCEVTHLLIQFDDEPCVLSYIRDLREQKKNETVLLAAKEQAEEATRAKSDFLARMSHEIRTPMNGVIGLTRLALESEPSPRQQDLLTKIQASAKILLGIINDILDFSKMEQGKLQLEMQPFFLSQIFGTIIDLLQPQAEKKDISFKQEIDTELFDRIEILGDSLRLSQILLNLCSNAIKFTERGEVRLSVQHEFSADNTTMRLSFFVKDTGIGISEEQQKMLFQPFSQADSSTTRKYGGTGLGLMISKLLVEQMGGTIRIQSALGQGSTFAFTISLPVLQETIEKSPSPVSSDTYLPSGRRVLVTEDNEINQEIIVAFLESFDITVILANNGQEALDILQEQDVDCIFMDIQMPVMDGLTAARKIRAEGRAEIRNKPIIAMTAHVMAEDIKKSMDAGMNAHLTKPIDYVQLANCLKQYLGIGSTP